MEEAAGQGAGEVMAEVAAEVLVALVRLVVTAATAVRQEAAVVGLVLALVQAQMGKAVTERREPLEFFHGR